MCPSVKTDSFMREGLNAQEELGAYSFDALGNREKPIAILGERWCLQTAKQDMDTICKGSCVMYGRNVMSV